MSEPRRRPKISWAAKLLTVSAVGVLLGLGLCGVSASFGHRIGEELFTAGTILFLLAAVLSAVGLVCLFLFGLNPKD